MSWRNQPLPVPSEEQKARSDSLRSPPVSRRGRTLISAKPVQGPEWSDLLSPPQTPPVGQNSRPFLQKPPRLHRYSFQEYQQQHLSWVEIHHLRALLWNSTKFRLRAQIPPMSPRPYELLLKPELALPSHFEKQIQELPHFEQPVD